MNHTKYVSTGCVVYGVHSVRPEEICATEVIFTELEHAEAYAAEVSTDPGVLAGAVTRFVINTPGLRRPTALYVQGQRQEVAHLSDDRTIAANGYLTARSMRTPQRRM